MAVLVTGGTGFIGSHLVSFLKSKNWDVVLFERDITQEKDIAGFVTDKKIEAVIHLAAVFGSRVDVDIQRVNVEGIKNVIELCKRVEAERLIFLSTIRVLSSEKNPYVDSKREAERIVKDSGVPYIILRPSLVYGRGDKKNLGFILKCARVLPILPSLSFSLQPIFVEDVVGIIEASLSFQTNTVLNIVGPEVLTFREVLKSVQKLNEKRFWVVDWPRFFGRILRGGAYLPIFPIPRWQLAALLDNHIFRGDDWEKLFNIKATRFADGLYEIIGHNSKN